MSDDRPRRAFNKVTFEQVVYSRNTDLLEHMLILAVLKSYRFYATIKQRLCPVLADNRSFRPDFTRPDFNFIYSFVAQFWETLARVGVAKDMSINADLIDLIFAKKAAQNLIAADDAHTILSWLKEDITTIDVDAEILRTLPANPMFLNWLEARAVDYELRRLSPASLGRSTVAEDFKATLRTLQDLRVGQFESFHMHPLTFILDETKASEPLIGGLLPEGGLCLLSGRAKNHKTWAAIDLGITAAAGGQWLSKFRIKASIAAFCDFELNQDTFRFRLKEISAAKGIDLQKLEGRFFPVTCDTDHILRTMRPSESRFAFVEAVLDRLADTLEPHFQTVAAIARLIILDSLYRIHAGTLDENSATDMTGFYHLVKAFAKRLNAAVVIVHHFSKGDPSAKMGGDRAAGSRVHRQYPNAYIELIPLKIPGCYRFEADVRDQPAVEPFALRWEFPLLKQAPDLDVDDVRTVESHDAKRIRKLKLLALLDGKSLARKDWLALARASGIKVGTRTFDRDKEELEVEGMVVCNREGKHEKAGCQGVGRVANGNLASRNGSSPTQNGNVTPSNLNEDPGKPK